MMDKSSHYMCVGQVTTDSKDKAACLAWGVCLVWAIWEAVVVEEVSNQI
jgi:uncharacterized membrane protein